MADLKKVRCPLTGVEVSGFGTGDLINNYIIRLMQVNGKSRVEAEKYARQVIVGGPAAVVPVIVATASPVALPSVSKQPIKADVAPKKETFVDRVAKKLGKKKK